MNNVPSRVDVVIIGAGPSGSIAAGLLVNKGYDVLVLEKQVFPRFSIGESLLPQCMEYIEEAGFMDAVQAAGLQHKNGAAFQCRGAYEAFNFEDKFTPGWGTTFQVERGPFDKILIDEAEKAGAVVHYECEVVDVAVDNGVETAPSVECRLKDGTLQTIECKFVLDASGFGRVLPRLLDLEEPSDYPVRRTVFTHVVDNIDDSRYDREKILVTVHPENERVWYWLIPFYDGRCSIGVVAEPEWFEQFGDSIEILKTAISQDSYFRDLLKNASFDFPARQISGYSCNVKKLCGDGFALLGNAGEFLDPVFSSGVTIAMHSAHLAAKVLDRQLKGEVVDWHEEYVKPLCLGVETFRTFVDTWYDGRLQSILFSGAKSPEIKDTNNPYVAESRRKVGVLAKVCKAVYSN